MYIRQKHCRIVAFSQCPIIKSRMTSFEVVTMDIASDGLSNLLELLYYVRQAFSYLTMLNHEIITPTICSIYALSDTVFFKSMCCCL